MFLRIPVYIASCKIKKESQDNENLYNVHAISAKDVPAVFIVLKRWKLDTISFNESKSAPPHSWA